MEHTNYCRQIVKQIKAMQGIPSVGQTGDLLQRVVDLSMASQKFLLPEGGVLFEDFQYRALDEDHEIRLPHKFCALEWRFDSSRQLPEGQIRLSKRVLFCREDEEGIRCTPVLWLDANGTWVVLHDFIVPFAGALGPLNSGPREIGVIPTVREQVQDPSNFMDEARVLVGFLNALACANVHVDRSEPKKSNKKIKAALPFDTYHVLTIDVPGGSAGAPSAAGGHRSPREHLRRGHIRRLDDGRRIWVNATVVAAGRGAGVISKDYAVRKTSP